MLQRCLVSCKWHRLRNINIRWLSLESHTYINRLSDRYEIQEKIGSGGFAQVFEVAREGHHYAAKVVNQRVYEENQEDFDSEVEICSELDHPNILKIYEVLKTGNSKEHFVVITDLCHGGDLFDAIVEKENFNEHDAASIMKQVFSALSHIHAHGIAHRDLKPENFLLKDKEGLHFGLTVMDFGFARKIESKPFQRVCGSPSYVAPEVLRGIGYGLECDLWSAGVISYTMLAGFPPFDGNTREELFKNIMKGDFEFESECWDHISQDAKELIAKLLQINPKRRPQAKECLDHLWIRENAPRAPVLKLPESFIHNLRKYNSHNILVSHAKKAMMKISEAASALHNIRGVFVQMDKDRDGELTKQEVLDGLKVSNLPLPNDINSLIDALAFPDSGHVRYTDFLVAAMDIKEWFNEDDCRQAFELFDLDQDGVISKRELITTLTSGPLGKRRANLDDILKAFDEADTDENAVLDYQEFKAMILR